jgi:negative regulator of genetic competence, sporulation and motility
MSNTRKHKDKGKWNNGLLEEVPDNLQNMWDRHNNDWGEFRKAKKDLKDKIAQKEMKREIKETEENIGITTGYSTLDEIISLVRNIPNDMELGGAVRQLFSREKE